MKRYDKTAPTDNNAFSSKRAQYEFLQKNVPDRAKEKIIFEKGVDFGDFQESEQGGHVDGKGNAELLTLVVRSLLRNARFVSGFNGEGWQLWIDENGLSNLEIDRLTVRQLMRVFELIIDRIRAVGGQIVVSAANGKIKSVEDLGEAYKVTFEGDNYFTAHDLLRCQVFTGENIRGYWVEVLSVDGNGILIAKSEFEEWGTEPLEGDECVLMGNTENTLRQNFISISATEDGQPRIDIMDGVKTKSFTDCLRARFGNLDGISDSWFPADNQPHGNGIYADNAYLRGTFLLTTGEDIKTKFSVMEGKIESSVEGLKTDFLKDKGFLANPTFDGFNHWTTENDTVFFLVGNKWIWANDNVLSKQGDGASIITDDGRRVIRIRNKYIKQVFEDYLSVPEIRTNIDGKKEAAAVYLSFFYKVKKAGKLTIVFENVNKDGFVEFETFAVSEDLETTATYQQFTASGLWNATGDFKLAFTGEICLYMLVLSTDRVETLANTYKTLFEQSERLVKISAAVFDKNDALLKETGLVLRPEGAGLYAQDGEGNIGLIGVSVEETGADGTTKTVIKLTADNIQLEGLVTANGNFKILEDGSIETTNGKFTGEVNATSGKIGGFQIGNGRIGSVATSSGSGGSLAIYDDFIRVGGSKAYVMFGNDVIPATAGGAFTAAGRIVNEAQNTYGSYGFDQANYGLLINVSGGTKNYGIESNAALKAPAFINTKAKVLTFSGSTYEVDFSQYNVILMYYNEPNYSGTNVNLPNESSVARQFGLSTLPNDFAAIVTFRVRTGSKNITLKGIYNQNESMQDYDMASGDSVTLLITKVDGFRYQILNHSS